MWRMGRGSARCESRAERSPEGGCRFRKRETAEEIGKAASNFITAPREPDSPDARVGTMRRSFQLEVEELEWANFSSGKMPLSVLRNQVKF